MPDPNPGATLEEQIDQCRSYVRHRQAIHTVDVAELEDHLREQIAGLVDAGLATDEAFLVAVKRMGNLDALSREFAREHSERLWVIAVRITEFGFTPNRVAALGENVILMVNLAWSTVLYLRLLLVGGSFAPLERWQTNYIPVYVAWAAIVAIFFPPLFGYI